MNTTAWIWTILVIVVVVVIVGILVAASSRRRRRVAEQQKAKDREHAGKLRDEAKVAGLDARDRQAVADRTTADAEQAAVEAERLRLEAERQSSAAAEHEAEARKKLHEAATVDPDVDASSSGLQGRGAHDSRQDGGAHDAG